MTNKKLGNKFELFFCEKLFSNGFWAHNFAQKQAGQPADVIAVKNTKAYLIDCKVCSKRGFNLDRIEANQDTAMDSWQKCGNGLGLFAFLVDEEIYMINYSWLDGYRCIKSFLSNLDIKTVGIPFDKWVMSCK